MYNLFTEVPTVAEFSRAFSVAFMFCFLFIIFSIWYNVRALTAEDLTLTSVSGAYIHKKYFLAFRCMCIRIIFI